PIRRVSYPRGIAHNPHTPFYSPPRSRADGWRHHQHPGDSPLPDQPDLGRPAVLVGIRPGVRADDPQLVGPLGLTRGRCTGRGPERALAPDRQAAPVPVRPEPQLPGLAEDPHAP